jgi:hypothetical protein
MQKMGSNQLVTFDEFFLILSKYITDSTLKESSVIDLFQDLIVNKNLLNQTNIKPQVSGSIEKITSSDKKVEDLSLGYIS